MRLGRLLPAVAIVVFGAVPVAVAADPFGAVEVADPLYAPGALTVSQPFFGADSTGDTLLASGYRPPGKKDQLAVYERCGGPPAVWQRTVLTDAANGVAANHALRVGRDGTAMVAWNVTEGGMYKHYSRTRPPGGAWGEPQLIVADANTSRVEIALSDSGAAVAMWADAAPAGTWASTRAANGAWEPPVLLTASTLFLNVAMSGAGDALVTYRHPTLGYVLTRYKPAGLAWEAEEEALRNNQAAGSLLEVEAEFDGAGRAVVMARYRELGDAVRLNVRGAGSGGTWAIQPAQWEQTWVDDDGANPPNTFFNLRKLHALVRHPGGAVAVWTRRNNFDDDVIVTRLRAGGWDAPTAFHVGRAFYEPRAAVNDAGEILLAGTVETAADLTEIHGMIAPSLIDDWPAPARLSPQASLTYQHRTPFAAGGGSAFSLGWSAYGTADDRTEVISTKPAGAACGEAATPTPTVSASPSPEPDPLPQPAATPPPAPQPTPKPAGPSAIADFTTLPKASTCIRGRKLTVRFKTPPKGYTVKAVTVKVNAKKVATVEGAKLKRPLYLRKLPTKPYTVTVSITLRKGKGLTEKRRYTPCK
jgi:hypothetical protein